MAKRKEVGTSERTPAKHALMNSIYGKEVGVVGWSRYHQGIQRHVWKDLTAGNGVTDNDVDWKSNCSPGINAHHATKAQRPVDVELYEIQPATFDRLLGSLADNLPTLGYVRVAETGWRFRDQVSLRAICGSGADAPVSDIRKTDAVLVSNDPNAITTWAMRPTFAQEIADRAWCFRSISTMGCNPAGLKRSDPSVRAGWFDLIKQQEAALPDHRDLLLTAIEGDASQWAYLLGEPSKWRSTMEKVVTGAFKRYGYSMEMAWHRADSGSFEALKSRLFLTRSELAR